MKQKTDRTRPIPSRKPVHGPPFDRSVQIIKTPYPAKRYPGTFPVLYIVACNTAG